MAENKTVHVPAQKQTAAQGQVLVSSTTTPRLHFETAVPQLGRRRGGGGWVGPKGKKTTSPRDDRSLARQSAPASVVGRYPRSRVEAALAAALSAVDGDGGKEDEGGTPVAARLTPPRW